MSIEINAMSKNDRIREKKREIQDLYQSVATMAFLDIITAEESQDLKDRLFYKDISYGQESDFLKRDEVEK